MSVLIHPLLHLLRIVSCYFFHLQCELFAVRTGARIMTKIRQCALGFPCIDRVLARKRPRQMVIVLSRDVAGENGVWSRQPQQESPQPKKSKSGFHPPIICLA